MFKNTFIVKLCSFIFLCYHDHNERIVHLSDKHWAVLEVNSMTIQIALTT